MADVAAADPENTEPANPKKRPREPATAPLPDELSLPLSAVMRIIKSRLPEGMMVGTDTKKAISKACSLFILYVSTMCAACPNFSGSGNALHVSCCHLCQASALTRPLICSRSACSASDCAKESNRQTMNATDILKALNELEFDDFLPPVEAALNAFREEEKVRSIQAAAKRAAQLKNKEGEEGDGGKEEGGDED